MSVLRALLHLRKEKTLRIIPAVTCGRFDSIHWMTAEDDVWAVPNTLTTNRPHAPCWRRASFRAWGAWTTAYSPPAWWARAG